MNNNGLWSGILMVALIVGVFMYYVGYAAAKQEAYKDGYDTGYYECQEEWESKLEEECDIAYGEGYATGYYDAEEGKPYEN